MTTPTHHLPALDAVGARDFRVFWQSIWPGGARFAYPAQEPLMTRQEADEDAAKENAKGYVRAWVIGRDGIGV